MSLPNVKQVINAETVLAMLEGANSGVADNYQCQAVCNHVSENWDHYGLNSFSSEVMTRFPFNASFDEVVIEPSESISKCLPPETSHYFVDIATKLHEWIYYAWSSLITNNGYVGAQQIKCTSRFEGGGCYVAEIIIPETYSNKLLAGKSITVNDETVILWDAESDFYKTKDELIKKGIGINGIEFLSYDCKETQTGNKGPDGKSAPLIELDFLRDFKSYLDPFSDGAWQVGEFSTITFKTGEIVRFEGGNAFLIPPEN